MQRGSVEALSIPQSARDDISDKEMTVGGNGSRWKPNLRFSDVII